MNRAIGMANRDQRELLVKFKVIKFLGKGSYGSVFQVQRLGDGQNYALKEMDCRSMSQAEREDSVNEVRLLASVRHSNVVAYHEAFLDGNRLCIIMEYAPDGDLSKVIKKWQMMRKPMPEDLIWKLFIQIVRGLSCLHNMRILHRDIKPGNIMVMSGDIAKIGDLGIAKLLTNTMAAKTQIGTPHYMPPEIWKNRPYSFSSDTWAMGCILYEMATFNVPFEARSMNELRVKVTRGTYPPVPSTYSKELADMVRDCLDQIPEKRPTMDRILNSPAVMSRMHLLGEGARAAPPSTAGSVLINTIKVPRGNLAGIKDRLPPANYASDMNNILGKFGAIPEGNEEPEIREFHKPPAPPEPYQKPIFVGAGPPPRPAPAPAPPQALLPRLPIIPGAAPRAPPPVMPPQYRYPAPAPALSPGAQSHITKLSAISKPAGVGVKAAAVSENHAAYGAFYHQGVKGPGANVKARVYEDIKAYAAANRKPWSGAAGFGAPGAPQPRPAGPGVRFAGIGVPGAAPIGAAAQAGQRPHPWNYGVKAGAQAAARAYVNQVRAGGAPGAGAAPPLYAQPPPWQAGGRRY